MHPVVVADSGGLLVLAGRLQGVTHDVDEIVALDSSALTVAFLLVLLHEGRPDQARSEYEGTCGVVREWFPLRGLAVDTALSALGDEIDGEGLAHWGWPTRSTFPS